MPAREGRLPAMGKEPLMLRAAIVSVVLWAGCLPAAAFAQKVAEEYVTTGAVAVRSDDGTMRAVPKGELVFASGSVKGDRFWMIHFGRHGTFQGSINRSDVIPLSQALDFFNKELTRNTTALAYIHRGSVWRAIGQSDKAIADWSEAIRLDPKNAYAYSARGGAWGAKNENDKAIADCNEAIRLDPMDVTAYNSRASARLRKGQYDKALADYDEVLRLDPKSSVAGDNRRNLREMKLKFDDCNRAIGLDSNDAGAYDRRGSAWMTIRQSDKAIADWSEAIRLDRNDVSAYKTRGSARMANRQYDLAIADWGEVIRLNPELPLAYHNRAYAWMKKGESDKAIADWTAAIRVDPQDASAYSNRGSAWLGKRQYDKALADYHAAIRLDPKFGEAYWGLAALFATCPDAKYRDGKQAVENAEKAGELLGLSDSGFVAVLAAAHAAAGDFDFAVTWQEQAIELAPEKSKAELRSRLDLYKVRKPYHADVK
jgi:tetratricopeptide (TPR) repeat protein